MKLKADAVMTLQQSMCAYTIDTHVLICLAYTTSTQNETITSFQINRAQRLVVHNSLQNINKQMLFTSIRNTLSLHNTHTLTHIYLVH